MGLTEAGLAMETMRGFLEEGPDLLPQVTAREKAQYWASIAVAEMLSGLVEQNEKIIDWLQSIESNQREQIGY